MDLNKPEEIPTSTPGVEAGPSGAPTPPPTVELPEISADQLASLSPDVATLYNNARQAIASSTKRYQEAADIRRQTEERNKELNELRETYKHYNEIIANLTQKPVSTVPTSPPPPPNFAEDPIGAYNYAVKEIQTLNESLNKLRNDAGMSFATIRYNDWYNGQIQPVYKNVSPTELRVYFEDHREMNMDDLKDWHKAASEISTQKKSAYDTDYQAYLKQKEEDAKKTVPLVGVNIAQIPPGKKFSELSPAEQEEILASGIRASINK